MCVGECSYLRQVSDDDDLVRPRQASQPSSDLDRCATTEIYTRKIVGSVRCV